MSTMIRSYLKQMKSIISLADRIGKIVYPYDYYDFRLSARIASIVNEMSEGKTTKKKK